MAFLKYKIWWFYNSDWFQHWFHEPVPMSSYGSCPISLLSVGVSLRLFLLKIGLISTYNMPPHLPCYLIRALRYSSINIQKFGILADTQSQSRSRSHYICTKHHGIFFPIFLYKNYTILCNLMRETQWSGSFFSAIIIKGDTWHFTLKFSKNSRCLPSSPSNLLPQIFALRLHEKFQYLSI